MKAKKYIIATMLLFFSFFIDKYLVFHRNFAFDYLFDSIFNFITVLIVFVFVASIFLYQEKKHRWILPLLFSTLVTIIATIFLKVLIGRTRPDIMLTLDYQLVKYSFPSMHTSIAFSSLAILIKEFKKIKWFWITFAVIIGLSRIYFNVHYLSDVIAGAMLGYFIGEAFYESEIKYKVFK